ncbi:beta-lactamase/transpeptidase-like protein [Lasiosphaeria miniovina]|uniref:Beta-lactamase/transpeptidase-like protein n=1 Tax=Lasiosphaeria miniovina TaxID=1954250 RepID=A0AA40ECS9_9PEZI|nr:beta-lactamase/transpeptidase-like protein [Lasiosphaeria miniovina]KAK0735260.1 beta-lactamase/transpeptidase-like protein [Lasiosphaeria miniovina]
MRNPTRRLLLLLAAVTARTALASPNCPPLGPVFEKPQNFNSSAAIRSALANLTQALTARDRDNSAAVLANTTSYSIEVFSTSGDTPVVFSWHHTASALAASNSSAAGVKRVDSSTVYRLGSLTKVFAVYTWLAQDGDAKWNEPITKYVPELAAAAERAKAENDPVKNVPWQDVTIGALASQLSGAIRDYGLLGELSQQINQSTAVSLGLPPLNSSDPMLNPCGQWPLCNRTQFFDGLLQAYPSYAPFTTPAYTNTGFQVLAYALESIKGKSFKSMMQDSILSPLGLNRTYYDSAPAEQGVIPGNASDSTWYYQLGDESPAGNMYSSVGDLSVLGRSILGSSLLAPALSRRWLKPAALTSEPVASVGYPWGIRRVILPLANGKRTVDAYNKAGRIGFYSSLINLLPDYDVGFSVLIAGPAIPGNSNFNLADFIGVRLVPALEAAAREQANAKYAGDYRSVSTNSSLRLTTQDDRPGLGIENWLSNGTDMQTTAVVLAAGYTGVQPSIRLYPTGLETVRADGSRSAAFKATFEDVGLPARNDMFSTDCGSWVTLTSVTYGTQSLDEFVFEIDRAGKVVSIESPALRVVMQKT